MSEPNGQHDAHVQVLTGEAAFARRLKEIRTSLKMSQAALAAVLAEHCGLELDPTAITRMERGTRGISLAEAHAITTVLGVSLDDMCRASHKREMQALRFALTQAEQEAHLADATADMALHQRSQALQRASDLKVDLARLRRVPSDE